MWGTSYARKARRSLACAALGLLGGCGTYVPDIQEGGNSTVGEDLVNAIVYSIHCELRNALADVFVKQSEAKLSVQLADFLQGWSVQMALTLTIEERTIVNPNFFMSFLPSLFTLGVTTNATTRATRVDKLNYYYSVQDLLKGGRCPDVVDRPLGSGSLLIRSDLKTKEWINSQLLNKFAGEFVSTKNGFQHQVTFFIDTGGGVTPGAKLATVTLMPAGVLVTAGRTRTHDLSLTFGPATDDDKSRQQLAPAAQAMFLANQISSALQSNAFRGLTVP
jgi:hypothetical protein